MQTHLIEPSVPRWEKDSLGRWRLFLVKRASPLTKRTHSMLWTSASKSLLCCPLVLLRISVHWRRKAGSLKGTGFPGRFILAKRSQEAPVFCLPSELPEKSKDGTAQGVSSPLWASFKLLLQWPKLCSQSRREKAIEKEVPSHILGIKSSQQARRGKCVFVCVWVCTCVHDVWTALQSHQPEAQHQPGGLCAGQEADGSPARMGWAWRGLEVKIHHAALEHAKINYQARQSSIWATMVNSDQEDPPQTIYPLPSKGNRPKRKLCDEQWFELLSKHLFPATELWNTFSVCSEGMCTPAFLWVIWH